MKRFQLYKLLPLVAFVFAACTDATTAPVTSSKLLPSTGVSFTKGHEPPPPVATANAVCVAGVCVVVDGRYNAKGGEPLGVAAITAEDAEIDAFGRVTGSCSFGGKAWIKFEKAKKPKHHHHGDRPYELKGRAKIECKDFDASGKGKIEYEVGGDKVVVKLDEVTFFNNAQDCNGYCASFIAPATLNGEDGFTAHGNAFDREYYDDFCSDFEGGEEEGFCQPPVPEGGGSP